MNSLKILFAAEASSGGIYEYGIMQVNAFAGAGIDVVYLCRETTDTSRLKNVQAIPCLPDRKSLANKLAKLRAFLRDSRKLANVMESICHDRGCDYVLLDCFREYFSPFWAGPLKRLHKSGVPIGVVAHDPVRDFVVGPKWWHRYCIRTAYSFISDVFVHDASRIDFGGVRPSGIRIHELPHGPFSYPAPKLSKDAFRQQLGLECDDRVYLFFGQIRDGKNLDTFIAAMPGMPGSHKLLVAGRLDSNSQKPVSYYKDLARQLGVQDRCVWITEYIPNDEINQYFEAADVAVLAYSKAFKSASGVLNIAVMNNKPMIASSGDGPLKETFKRYNLGIWMEEVTRENILHAANAISLSPDSDSFDRYLKDHSWERNAEVVISAIKGGKK